MTKNNLSNCNGVRVKFNNAYIESQGSETFMVLNGMSMHDMFLQLTAQDIVSLIPDQSTLSEVRDLLC